MKKKRRKQMSNPNKEIVNISFYNSAYTNTYDINVLLSIKQKKFIKPVLMKNLEFEYALFPGNYILISSGGKIDREIMNWRVMKIKLFRNEFGVGDYKSDQYAEWVTPTNQALRTVPILKDIPLPGYHRYPEISFTKIYSDEEINAVLQGGIDTALEKELDQ
jgi:hypothetical protein